MKTEEAAIMSLKMINHCFYGFQIRIITSSNNFIQSTVCAAPFFKGRESYHKPTPRNPKKLEKIKSLKLLYLI